MMMQHVGEWDVWDVVIHCNMGLLIHALSLYFDIASRVDIHVQEDSLLQDVRSFFAAFHNFYLTHTDAASQEIYTTILLQVKQGCVLPRQKDRSFEVFSFELLRLLRGTHACLSQL
jgi:hypothetical protein